MKNIVDFRQLVNLSLGFDSRYKEIPIDIPCHAYAIGLLCDYHIGEFLGELVDSHTSDIAFINILSQELNLMNLRLSDIDYSDISKLCSVKRIIQITRMSTPCRDYHFYLLHPNGMVSQKYRYSNPEYSSKIDWNYGEYSLGIYSIERAL